MSTASKKPKTSQAGEVLKYLKSGKALTAPEAQKKFGCSRLASVVFKLGKRGIVIKSTPITGFTRYKTPSTYASYSIDFKVTPKKLLK